MSPFKVSNKGSEILVNHESSDSGNEKDIVEESHEKGAKKAAEAFISTP